MSTQPQEALRQALSQVEGIRVRVDEEGSGHKGKYVNIAVEEQLVRLLAAGIRFKDAAKQLGLTSYRSTQLVRRADVAAKLKELNSQIYEEIDNELKFRAKATHEKLHTAADEALDKVIDLMRDADSQMIQFRAAQDLMDRRPDTSKVHRIDKRQINVNIDEKWLALAAQAEADESGSSSQVTTIEGGAGG